MGTFTLIGIYAVLVLVGLTVAAGLFVLLGIWLSDASAPEQEA